MEIPEYSCDQVFENLKGQETNLSGKDFEDCIFESCSFGASDIKNCRFSNCLFIDSDWSNSNLLNSSFQDCEFKNCKLMGLHFEKSNQIGFSVRFHGCNLDFSSFYQMRLDRCSFALNSVKAVDFSLANCKNIKIVNCDLLDAKFEQSHLEGCNLQGSVNFQIDPEQNYLKGCQISKESVGGLLTKYDIVLID